MANRYFIAVCFLFMLTAGALLISSDDTSAEELQYGAWTYTVDNDKVTIIGWDLRISDTAVSGTILNIPGTIDGKDVIGVNGKGSKYWAGHTITEIKLPATVKKLNSAFEGLTALETVNLSNVTTIAGNAFRGCTSLVNVTMPIHSFKFEDDQTSYHRSYIFEDCTSLKEIDLRNLNGSILNRAFQRCTSLQTVHLPDSEYSMGHSVFRGCTSLTTIDISNATPDVSIYCFADCTSLKDIIMPAGNYNLSSGEFENCRSLETIDLRNIEKLGSPFKNCTSLESIHVGEGSGYSNIDGVVVSKGKDAIVLFPPGRTGDYKVPDGVIEVIYGAFNSSQIKNLDLNEVVTLGYGAFSTSVLLETAEISNISDFGTAFEGCISLIKFKAERSIIYSADDNGIIYDKDGTKLIRAPPALTETNLVVAETVTEIASGAFRECAILKSIDLSNVTVLGDHAFYKCTSLTDVDITKFTRINTYVFYECRSLKNLDLSKATYIGDYAFYGCISLQTVDMTSVTHIGNNAFEGCTTFIRVIAPVAEYIGHCAFSGCDNLVIADISEAKTIGERAFDLDSKLISVNISSAREVGNNAFRQCTSLTTVKMPTDPYILGGGAFSGCSALRTMDLKGVTEMNGSVFKDCVSLEYVNAPNLEQVSFSVFEGCTSLTYVYLPKLEELTNIANRIFYNCTSLEVIYAPKLEARGINISTDSLTNCYSLKRMIIADIPALNMTGLNNLRDIYITSDYAGTMPTDISELVTIYRSPDAEGWPDTVQTFHYVSYIQENIEVMKDAVPDGRQARQVIHLEEGKIWTIDGEEYNFARQVTSDIELRVGTIVIQAEDSEPEKENDMTMILAAVASVAAIIVLAIIFLIRRPA